jgi:hypothetical protein
MSPIVGTTFDGCRLGCLTRRSNEILDSGSSINRTAGNISLEMKVELPGTLTPLMAQALFGASRFRF